MKAASLALFLCALAACGPSAIDGGFDSANPAARMYAIENAARQGDQDAVMQIVEQLDSDDPAVRLLAIGALERLTGHTHGYRHYDPPHLREQAVASWRDALDNGSLMEPIHHADQSSALTSDG